MDPLGSDALASKQVHVTVASEAINWKNVVNKQLLTGLAENPRLKLTGFVTGLTPEQKSYARSLGIELVDTDERDELYDFSNSELLSYPPESLKIDIFLIHSYESGLGKQAQLVRKHRRNCKWVQVVHTISEELLPFLESPEEYKDEHKRKIGLCEKADLVIAVGPKVYEAYKRALSASRNDEKLIPFVPGIIKELSNICQVHENSNFENFVVLVSGSTLHFKVKGFDIAAKAFSLLEKSYHLMVVLRSTETPEKEEKIKQSLLELGIDCCQLKVRKPESHLDWQGLLREVDLLIKPSRTEGFGMSGLRAISARLPVLVRDQCGLGTILSRLPTGNNCLVTSDDPDVWADKIREMRGMDPRDRHSQAEKLQEEYANQFKLKEQCDELVNAFVGLVQRREGDTQHITQGAGSNESVENARKKVDTTVLSNKSKQSRTQYVAGCDVVDAGMKAPLEKVPVCRLNKKVTEIPLKVYAQVCVKLNLKRELRFDDFRMLAEKIGLTKEEIVIIGQYYSDPTDEILKTWSSKNEATVGNLIELLKEPNFDRQDVEQILQDWVNEV